MQSHFHQKENMAPYDLIVEVNFHALYFPIETKKGKVR